MRANFLSPPQMFRLDHACHAIRYAYDEPPYLVGSALQRANYRDVDVRLILPDKRFRQLFPDVEDDIRVHTQQQLLQGAVSDWLANATGLLIDFQFQSQTEANQYKEPRCALGFILSLSD